MIKQSHIAFALLMFLEEARSMTYTDKEKRNKKKNMADWKPENDCKCCVFRPFEKSSSRCISI